MPELLPVLAVRDAVHFPGLVNTLHVAREPSVRAVRRANDGDRRVLVLSQRDMAVADPKPNDLFEIGTLSETLQAIPLPDASLRVALRGLRRVRANRLLEKGGLFFAEVVEVDEVLARGPHAEALTRSAIQTFANVVERCTEIPPEALEGVAHAEGAGLLADTILHHLPLKAHQKQDLLEEFDEVKRLEATLFLLKREEQILDLNARIHERVEQELGDTQREYYLREQLRVIQNELREREDRVDEAEEFGFKIERSGMPPEARDKAYAELKRLDRASHASPEAMVIRNYLETLIALPWDRQTDDRLDVNEAARLLDARHHGLERVKDRILDHLAVRQLKGRPRGPVLLFTGPPGVGKTSLARSIADALGRRFVRIALGGVRDEAEIRGHRRTYVGSMPGRILQGLRDCGSRNPVVVLDEIDKLGSSPAGDPMSALLEALDPEQNPRFSDHYVEVPFDISETMFIATANLLERVPGPLRDRMEVISFPSYTEEERRTIAREFLFPAAREDSGLDPDQLQLPDAALTTLVREYTREAGVRDLRRRLETLGRRAARRVASGESDRIVLDAPTLTAFLGQPPFRTNVPEAGEVGVAWGLVVSEAGGGVVPIEATILSSGENAPRLRLTGQLGDVMKESGHAALTVLRARIAEPFSGEAHVHVPEGAVPKDGPSAGLAIFAALWSARLGTPPSAGFAITGEITLRGRVLGVGGIRDKVLAALANGFTEVIIPAENVGDLDEVPTAARERLRIHPISKVEEALALLWPPQSP